MTFTKFSFPTGGYDEYERIEENSQRKEGMTITKDWLLELY